jgi:cell filamentation protein
MYNEAQSKYCYPGTDVLINHADLRDQNALDQFEGVVTYLRALELQRTPLRGNFDLPHLCAIHRYLFQDVYPFAGNLRDENIAKGHFRFCQWEYINDQATLLFRELKKERFLLGASRTELPERLAFYMAEINVLHPFREGNGRAQREFIRSLALFNGYDLSWKRVEPDALLEASIRSITNTTELAELIDRAIINRQPDPQLMKLMRKAKSQQMER